MGLEQGILDDFAVEAHELLDEAEDALLKIEKTEDLKPIYDMVFRAFHSLKGSSGMVGLDDLQRHLHLLEDYLQKSKNDLKRFKESTDYYLKGIDASRKILNGELVQFTYDVQATTPVVKEAVLDLKKKKLLYLSNSDKKPLGEEILSLENALGFSMRFLTTLDLANKDLSKEEYVVLVSDLSIDVLNNLIPANKKKYPLLLISEESVPVVSLTDVFLVLNKSDDKTRVHLFLQNALEKYIALELYDKAKALLMYMYSDLEDYLIEKDKVDIQKTLNIEIQNFIKDYKR